MKARNLQILHDNGFLVPRFFVVNGVEDIKPTFTFLLDDEKTYAVRSSFCMEDGTHSSFAGQFETLLNVPKKDIKKAVIEIKNGFSVDNVQKYAKEHGIQVNKNDGRVIIQEMIQAEYSGVIFTANPLGILNETVITIGEGLGNNVVEDKIYTTTYYYNHDDALYYYEQQEHSPLIPEKLFKHLITLSQQIKKLFEKDVDIEFAIQNGKIYILQARPITTIRTKFPLILDNSNIVESYPHISLPLTQDFVKSVYHDIFYNCLVRITESKTLIDSMDNNLQDMVAIANWRIYYCISNWYAVLHLLPMSKKIISMWQKMLGVNNKTITLPSVPHIPYKVKFNVLKNFLHYLRKTPELMNDLNLAFDKRFQQYQQIVESANTVQELVEIHERIKADILKDWDLTLINDMYAFIYTALAGDKNKEAISNIKNLESLKPVLSIQELTSVAKQYGLDSQEYINKKQKHIENFGDRCLCELKLETQTYRTHPELLDGYIKQQLQVNPSIQENVEKPSKNPFVNRAKIGIKNREISRLNRSRLYGLIRTIFRKAGSIMAINGKINTEEDVFYLYIQELTDNNINHKEIVEQRKQAYAIYETIPAYSRLCFADKIINKTMVTNTVSLQNTNTLNGIPTSTGIVEGEVLVVEVPNDSMDTTEKILVTKSTDPGWILLIQNAKGIIAEKGSLLSHTAIISRELHKPAIVNVKNCTQILKNGDKIRLNAETGVIDIIRRAK